MGTKSDTNGSFYTTMLDTGNELNPEPGCHSWKNAQTKKQARHRKQLQPSLYRKQLKILQAQEIRARKIEIALQSEITKLVYKLNNQKVERSRLERKRCMLKREIETTEKMV